jgi:hypothetical protein
VILQWQGDVRGSAGDRRSGDLRQDNLLSPDIEDVKGAAVLLEGIAEGLGPHHPATATSEEAWAFVSGAPRSTLPRVGEPGVVVELAPRAAGRPAR